MGCQCLLCSLTSKNQNQPFFWFPECIGLGFLCLSMPVCAPSFGSRPCRHSVYMKNDEFSVWKSGLGSKAGWQTGIEKEQRKNLNPCICTSGKSKKWVDFWFFEVNWAKKTIWTTIARRFSQSFGKFLQSMEKKRTMEGDGEENGH